MRKLGSAQRAVLRLINERYSLAGGTRMPAGLTKSAMLSSDWRVVDRLTALGLLQDRFVPGEGPTYFITDAGRAAIGVAIAAPPPILTEKSRNCRS
jgi:hypothetical protein